MDDTTIESIIYICREVYVYKIPPLKKNEGHRAQDWGDLAEPLWKGRLRITETSDAAPATMMLEDATTGERTIARQYYPRALLRWTVVFAKTTYDPARPSVEAVLDSSRYFVVRIEDAGKKAYIGMGFVERSESFDFNVALQDYSKRWKARMNPPSPMDGEGPSPHLPSGPKKDYSLKEGQTFSISIPGRANKSAPQANAGIGSLDLFAPSGSSSSISPSSSSSSVSKSGGGTFPLLPPPPGAPKRS